MLKLNNGLIKKTDHNVVIIGYSATGKTMLSNYLHELYPDFKIFHSDDYMQYGFQESLYVMMTAIGHYRTGAYLSDNLNPKIMVEGIQGVRLLRKGLQQKSFFADLVIIVEASKATRQKRYIEQRHSPEKIRYLNGFDSMLDKISSDYFEEVKKYKFQPRIVKLNTD